MKKISLILSIIALFALALTFLGTRTAEAGGYNEGCYGTNLYSITTGMPCQYGQTYYNANQTTNYIPGCEGYNVYSVVTGQPCNGGVNQSQYTQANDSYLFVRELTVGARGEDVTALQEILQSRGYSMGTLDGVYGKRTRFAVMNYQQTRGIAVTGRADWTTLSSLTSNATPVPPPCPLSSTPTNPEYPCPPTYGAPSISQVSGPQTLSLNQDGTWTVLASDVRGGNLTYSVDWGDQPYYAYGQAVPMYYPQQSATFTHRYTIAGTYNPVFTVTNSAGQTAKTSIQVVVSSGYNNNLTAVISYLAPNYGRSGTAVTVYGRNFSYSGNVVNFGGTQISSIYSWNGTSLTFNVPNVTQIYCVQAPCVQNFNVTVSSGPNSTSSNSLMYTVTY